MNYYLRLEGVNLDNFVYDTKDISTVRGGSLLLLSAIKKVADEKKFGLKRLRGGASAGLFSFEAKDDGAADKLAQEVLDFLRGGTQLKHATFVCDVRPAGAANEFVTRRRQLETLNRWSQMQAPSIAVPSQPQQTLGAGRCDLDRLRPACHRDHKGPEQLFVSESVYQRRQHGKAKKEFYEAITALKIGEEFSEDLDDLTNDPERGNLHHKMAVIYVDGNDFGKIHDDVCTDEKGQGEFDEGMEAYRTALLTNLLKEMQLRKGPKGDRLRIETLLWGGDEILWVVPAWAGWWTLDFFFKQVAKWTTPVKPKWGTLKFAAGLVFCHHNAPIHRIRRLAQDLAERAKDKDRERNLFGYQILESFDHAGLDLSEVRRRRCPKGSNVEELILDGGSMGKAAENFAIIGDKLPRGKVYDIAEALLEDRDAAAVMASVATAVQGGPSKDAFEKLRNALGGDSKVFWIHLAELWDYLVPDEASGAPDA